MLLLSLFCLPLFHFVFLCLSLFFFSFFLPSCLSFSLSFASLFLSLSFLFFLLCLCFMKRTTLNYSVTKLCFTNSLSFFCFPSCFFFQTPFSYLCSFQICLFNINVCGFKNTSSKTPIFGQEEGFFMNLCFANCEKLSFFGGHFLANFG